MGIARISLSIARETASTNAAEAPLNTNSPFLSPQTGHRDRDCPPEKNFEWGNPSKWDDIIGKTHLFESLLRVVLQLFHGSVTEALENASVHLPLDNQLIDGNPYVM